MSQAEFAEEVFEECLLKFYELFEERVFEKYSDLEATIVRISDFKIKEGFAKIKRDQRLYFMNAEALSAMREKHLKKQDDQEKEKVELISEIHQHLSTLPPEDSNLILRYFNGEDLKDLAGEYNISPAACRKRKQRIIEKLKNLVINWYYAFSPSGATMPACPVGRFVDILTHFYQPQRGGNACLSGRQVWLN